jgi:hypothetical protein
MAIPTWLNQNLNITGNAIGTVKALTLFVILPLVFFLIFALAKKLLTGESWKNGFSQLVLAILPVTASMHLLKALFKTSSRIPYWKFVFSDPEGVDSATDIIQNAQLLQNGFLTNAISPTIGFIAVLLPILGSILSFYVIKKQVHIDRISRIISILAVTIYACIFIVTMIERKVI